MIDKDKDLGLQFIEYTSPFKDLSSEEINKLLEEISQKAENELKQSVEQTLTLIKPFSIENLVGWFSLYCLTQPYGDVINEFNDNRLKQFQVELLQALALKKEINNDIDWRPILPPDVEKVSNLLISISESFALCRLNSINSKDEEEKKQLFIMETIRSSTMAVRNWAYPDQIIKVLKGLFINIDNDVEESYGYSILGLIVMNINIIKKIEERTTKHTKKSSRIYNSKNVEEVIDNYISAYPDIETTKKDLIQLSNKFNSKEDFTNALILHTDLFIEEIYKLSVSDFIEAYPKDIEEKVIKKVLNIWSFEKGELVDYPYEYLFLGNPIWEKPLIKLEENLYFWPIPGLFYHSNMRLMEKVFEKDLKLKEKYEKYRGKYLEDTVEKLFNETFPEAKIYKGSIWHHEETDKDFENDLLVIIENYAIVIEAKAGKITDSARRGAPKRLKNEIEKLLVDPSIQARRFAKFLENNSGIHEFSNINGETYSVDLSNTNNILTLGVTLELFGPLATNMPELYKGGFIENKEDLSPNMSLTDLELIFDLLETSIEKLHYFIRRDQFERNANYFADEIDLLAFYLKTGFNIGSSEFEEKELNFYGLSKTEELEHYLLYRNDDNVETEKPKPLRTKWWNDIILKLEQKKISHWTDSAYMLLNVSYEDQIEFEDMFSKVKESVKIEWKKEGHLNSVILFNGPEERKDLIIGFAYKRKSREKRNNMIKDIATEQMEKYNQDKALIIGIDVDKSDYHYPYSILALVARDY